MTTRTHSTRRTTRRDNTATTPESRAAPPRIGERYRVIEPLGEGGMAAVLVLLSVLVDSKLYLRCAPALLVQLEHDTGLDHYRALPAEQEPGSRLQAALGRALERAAETREEQRVYRLDDGIRNLALVLSVAIVIGVRGRDSKLIDSLGDRLAPFAPLSPLLRALWQNLVSVPELNHRAQYERARARALEVYESLSRCSGDELRYVDAIRHAVCYAIGAVDVASGNPSAETWIELLDNDPLQRINGLYLRECSSLHEGDVASAERYRAQAEVLAVRVSARQMFDPPAFMRVSANAYARNLPGLKQVSESYAQRAPNAPQLRSLASLASGMYQRLRGDLLAALAAFDTCIELEDPARAEPPPWLDVWPLAAAGRVGVLSALGRVREARAYGLAALEQATALGIINLSHELVRELALAEAKLRDFAGAARRLDQLIARRSHLLPGRLAVDCEARACVAIWAGDAAGAAHFAELALKRAGRGDDSARLLRETRLIYEARASGLEISFLPSEFESAVLGEADLNTRPKLIAKVTVALQRAKDPKARACRALWLLCKPVRAPAAQFFLVVDGALKHAASYGEQCSDALNGFVLDYWRTRLHDDLETQVDLTTIDGMNAGIELTTNVPDTQYRLVLLTCAGAHELIDIGILALDRVARASWPDTYPQLLAAVATRLYELDDARGVTLR